MRRLIVALGQPLVSDGFQHYSFPSTSSFLAADDDLLRAAGLSVGKLMTLRRVGNALAAGTLDEATLERQASPDATAILSRIKGIGPWSAAVVLLRGLGRLDVFPMNDTSVTRNLGLVSDSAAVDLESALRLLRPQQGMLYYHLLLARLETQGDLGRPSASVGSTALE
ncbi:MAG: DNA-3-methyladenine glycosylase family protein [Gemmatimonadaceae bacterium]